VGAPVCASAGSADIAVPSGASSVNGEYGSNPFWRSSAASARSCIAAGDDDLGRQTWSSSRLRFSGNASGAADGFESCHPRVATPVAAGSRTSSLRSPCPSRPGSHAGARPSSGSASVFGRLLSLGRGGVAVVPLPPPSREDAIAAAKEGSVDVLSEWLHHHLDQINDEVEDGYTLLHLAAEEGRVGAVKLLLSLGAAVETMDQDLQTPLHLAAAGGHLAVVQVLAPEKLNCAEILQEDKYKMTPWHLAVESGNFDLVSYLLSAFPQNIKRRERTGTALFMAHRGNYNEIVRLLESPGETTASGTFSGGCPPADEADDGPPLSTAHTVQEAARRWEQAHPESAAPPADSRECVREVRFTAETLQRSIESSVSSGGTAGGKRLFTVGPGEQAHAEGAAHESGTEAGAAIDQGGEELAWAAGVDRPAGCACCII